MKNFKRLAMLLCAISAALTLPRSGAASGSVGVRQVTVHSIERGRDLDTMVWYPADAGGKPVTLGETEFFVGMPAMLDAPISSGRYPLILLSHGAGLGGTPQAMSWMAAALAEQGYIVAAPTHYGNGGAIRLAAETMKLWLRPTDISATLDAIEGAPPFEDHIVSGKIGVVGLSMGGNTALVLAGGRIDSSRLASYCDDSTRNASLCGWVKQSGVDLHAMDMTLADRDNTDRRIKFAMAIDPAPVDVFRIDSFSKISIPVEIVNLGRPGKIPPTVLASGIARAISSGSYYTIEDASHFSMFGECKPGAAELAKSKDIDEPICSDGGGRPRQELHRKMIDLVVDALDRRFKAEAQ